MPTPYNASYFSLGALDRYCPLLKGYFFFPPACLWYFFKTGVLWSGSEVWNHRSCLRRAGLLSLTQAHHTFTMGLQRLYVHTDPMELYTIKKYQLSSQLAGSFQLQDRKNRFPTLTSQNLWMFQCFFIKLKNINIYIHFPCQVLSYFLMETLSCHILWRILVQELCTWKLVSFFQLYELIRENNCGFLFLNNHFSYILRTSNFKWCIINIVVIITIIVKD